MTVREMARGRCPFCDFTGSFSDVLDHQKIVHPERVKPPMTSQEHSYTPRDGDHYDPVRDATPEESGRPPIDADRTEHRRWINAVLDEYIGLRHKLGSAAPMGYDKAEMARQTAEVREQMVQAYMDGNEAERKTLEFKANEFVVPNDGDYVVAIEQYAVKFAAHYRLSVWHKQKKVLVLYGLTEREFALESDAIRNINSEGP